MSTPDVQVHTPLLASSTAFTEHRDTSRSHYVIARHYPTGDVEAIALFLDSDQDLKKGGGAKRQATSAAEQSPVVIQKSVQRARVNIRRKCLTLQADRMLTLTFRHNVTDLNDAWKCFSYFVKLMKAHYGERFAYIAVPEYQKRGAVHFHLAIRGRYPVGVVRKFWRRAVGSYEGNIDITSPRKLADKNSWNPKRIANYLAKYLSKEATSEFNRRRYSSGGKIKVPDAQRAWLCLGAQVVLTVRDAIENMTDKRVETIKDLQSYYPMVIFST